MIFNTKLAIIKVEKLENLSTQKLNKNKALQRRPRTIDITNSDFKIKRTIIYLNNNYTHP